MEINLNKYNLINSIKTTVKRVEELVKKEGYIIKFEHSDDINIMADEVKITGVFYNLLLNAINHSGDDKEIIVRQRLDNSKIKIEVIDKGEGISQENLPYIWDRYYKIDKKHKREITGTRLGLAIVKKNFDLHNGEYGAISE